MSAFSVLGLMAIVFVIGAIMARLFWTRRRYTQNDLGWQQRVWVWTSGDRQIIEPALADAARRMLAAAAAGDVAVVRRGIESGVPVNVENWQGTALARAVRYSHLAVARYLLEQGARLDTEHPDYHRHWPIGIAIARDDVAMIQLFIQAGVVPHDLVIQDLPLLSLAVMQRAVQAAQMLLAHARGPLRGTDAPLDWAKKTTSQSSTDSPHARQRLEIVRVLETRVAEGA